MAGRNSCTPVMLVLSFILLSPWINHGLSRKLLNYTDHPCIRNCSEGKPMTCTYNFTVEYYYVLGVECGDCPFNATDCKAPGCVPADGVSRLVVTVNRMIPGPGIQVCLGDTVVVNVHNNLEGAEGLSIHWHGMRMKGYQHMDGVTMITQCPIPAHTTFQYRFTVKNSGTHYWHAHSGLQRGEGVFGSLIVRQADVHEVHRKLYDEDLPEHTVHVQDWLLQPTVERLVGLHHGGMDNNPHSMLINGQGSFQSFLNGNTGQILHTPHAEFTVSPNTSYRFRVISNGVLNCPIRISVDNHTLLMIATDGEPFEPILVNSFNIFAGERFDFVLNATSDVDSYWIRATGLDDCIKKNAREVAILKYKGTNNTYPVADKHSQTKNEEEIELNPVTDMNSSSVVLLTDLNSTSIDDAIKEEPDSRLYVAMEFNQMDSHALSHGDLMPIMQEMGVMRHAHSAQMNGISFLTPPSPPLSQIYDIPEELFCNTDTVKVNCSTHYCKCIHRLMVDIGATIELILVGEGKVLNVSYPMHLHGHSFRVVAMDKLGAFTTVEEVKRLDEEGGVKRRLTGAVRKDTIAVPDGGYAVIRFVADNPGIWLFHSHVAFHLVTGMQLILQVGKSDQLPKPPSDFPRCGNWHYTDTHATVTTTKPDDDVPHKTNCPVCSKAGLVVQNNWIVVVGIVILCSETIVGRNLQ